MGARLVLALAPVASTRVAWRYQEHLRRQLGAALPKEDRPASAAAASPETGNVRAAKSSLYTLYEKRRMVQGTQYLCKFCTLRGVVLLDFQWRSAVVFDTRRLPSEPPHWPLPEVEESEGLGRKIASALGRHFRRGARAAADATPPVRDGK